jgi:hypothetical protein
MEFGSGVNLAPNRVEPSKVVVFKGIPFHVTQEKV